MPDVGFSRCIVLWGQGCCNSGNLIVPSLCLYASRICNPLLVLHGRTEEVLFNNLSRLIEWHFHLWSVIDFTLRKTWYRLRIKTILPGCFLATDIAKSIQKERVKEFSVVRENCGDFFNHSLLGYSSSHFISLCVLVNAHFPQCTREMYSLCPHPKDTQRPHGCWCILAELTIL